MAPLRTPHHSSPAALRRCVLGRRLPSCQGHGKLPGALRPARSHLPPALHSRQLRLATSCSCCSAQRQSALTQEQRPVGPACYALLPQRAESAGRWPCAPRRPLCSAQPKSAAATVCLAQSIDTRAQHDEAGLPVGSRSGHALDLNIQNVTYPSWIRESSAQLWPEPLAWLFACFSPYPARPALSQMCALATQATKRVPRSRPGLLWNKQESTTEGTKAFIARPI